jgi:hypothetical protein
MAEFNLNTQAEADMVLDGLSERDRATFGITLVGMLLVQMSKDDELDKRNREMAHGLAVMLRKATHDLGVSRDELAAQKDLLQFILVLRDGNPL